MANIKDAKELNAQLSRRRDLLKSIEQAEKTNLKANYDKKNVLKDIAKLEKEISNIKKQDDNFLKLEKEITKQKKEQAAIGKMSASLEKQLNKLKDSGVGTILKEINLTKSLDKTIAASKKTTGDAQKAFNLASEVQLAAIEDIKAGTFDATEFMANFEEQLEGLGPAAKAAGVTAKKELEAFAEIAKEGGDALSDSLNIDAKDLDGLEDARTSLKKWSAIASSPALMGAAAIGLAVKLITDFASKALEVKQSLGVSALESARIATNLKAASLSAKAFGGSAEQAEAAVLSLEENFGSIDNISLGVSTSVGALVGKFGMAGDATGKLLKSMEGISGASMETNIALLEATAQLARAEGVSPAKVLNDMAEDTETFAKFGKDGGRNIAAAAVQARKLGISMSTVAGIAESLLDFESSIEKQMEASVLVGRQLNLDKARELALMGDLDGLQKEVVNQVGSQADFEAMNVVQRKAMADAMGITVADMAKMVAGEKTSAKLAEEAADAEKERISLTTKLAQQTANLNIASLVGQGINTAIAAVTMMRLKTEEKVTSEKVKGSIVETKSLAKTIGGAAASLARGVGSIFTGTSVLGPFGIPIAIAAVAGMYALAKKAKGTVPKAETGGIVKETGIAEIHKGEAISGTKNEMGFGANMKETEKLLGENTAAVKALTAKHTELMNSLTGKVGEMAMSS